MKSDFRRLKKQTTPNNLSDHSFLMYQEAVAIGRTFASMKDYQVDGNKEMIALGTMNVVGSMTSCYVATGKKISFLYGKSLENPKNYPIFND